MELRDQTFENEWVRLEPLEPSPELREMVRVSGIMDSIWEWMPRLSGRGTTFDTYYDDLFAKTKAGSVLPLIASKKSDGTFVGGAAYLRMSRTHRSAQIDYVWTPNHIRGSKVPLAIQAVMLKGLVEWRAKRAYWIVNIRNERMTSFLEEKIGAKKEGEFEYYARMNDGSWSTSAVYGLVGDGILKAVKRIEATLEREFAVTD